MGIYARYKRSPEGFRALVELLESTPLAKRKIMIDRGMDEDADFTRLALSYCLSFEDIQNLSEGELAEVLSRASGRLVGLALCSIQEPLPQEKISKFIRCSPPAIVSEMRDILEGPLPKGAEIGGARLKLIKLAREAERAGYLKVKMIPFKIPSV